MGIFHEAYFFQPNEFAAKISTYIADRATGQLKYQQLRSDVLALFDQSPFVRTLADIYGSWDKEGVDSTIPEDQPRERDTGSLIMYLLYNHLSGPKDHRLGLGPHLDEFYQILDVMGWSKQKRGLLIAGRSFYEFAQKWLYAEREAVSIPGYWNHVYPHSTVPRAGWLDFGDVKKLLDDLSTDEHKIPTMKLAGNATPTEIYQMAQDMLLAAKANKSALVMISSG
jgi:hypothetical protein